jgi:uncharacterized membrane protein YeaQ/YmgE (transglycosylase-associated protein family)
MGEYLPLIIQLISGVIGGNIAGKIFTNFSMGALGNSAAGILGGGLGGSLLMMMDFTEEGMEAETVLNLETVLGSIAAGGVGGIVVMALIGGLRRAFLK